MLPPCLSPTVISGVQHPEGTSPQHLMSHSTDTSWESKNKGHFGVRINFLSLAFSCSSCPPIPRDYQQEIGTAILAGHTMHHLSSKAVANTSQSKTKLEPIITII